MKSIFYTFIFSILGVFTLNAQIADNSVAPDWTAVDINGVEVNLYNQLDSGYSVLLDLSATWCGPCWTIHEAGLLQDLHDAYGPNGTNELRVYYIESQASNTIDQLHGIGTSGGGANRATDTQGDWIADHTFQFIDDATIAGLYELNAYPTLTFIGADRLTRTFVGSPGPSVAAIYDLVQTNAGPPVTGTDARLLGYTGDELSFCGAFTPSVTLQNHGTDTLTSLTIAVLGDGTILDSVVWTGSLPPYEVTEANMNAVDGQGYTEFAVEILSPDADSSNNLLDLPGFTIIGVSTTTEFDLEDTPMGELALPAGTNEDPGNSMALLNVSNDDFNGITQSIGGFGDSEHSVMFRFYDFQSGSGAFYLDKIDVSSVGVDPTLNFSHAYRQYSAESDRLQVAVSTDCGVSWSILFNEAGAALATTPAAQAYYVPLVSEWRSNTVDLSAYSDQTELLIGFIGISNYGNNLFVDDILIEGVSGVAQIENIGSSKLYPNPAKASSTLELNLDNTEEVNIFVIDNLGRRVQSVYTGTLTEGRNNINVDLTSLHSGRYNVIIQSLEGKAANSLGLIVE